MKGNALSLVPEYSGRPIDFSPSPITFTKAQAQSIESVLTSLLREVEDFTSQLEKNRSSLTQLNLPEDLDLTPTPLGLHIPFARFDFVFDGKNLQVLELNTDGTSGYNITEWVAKQARLSVDENPNENLSLRLLSALREHAPKSREIAIVDFQGIATSWEQRDLVKKWKSSDLDCHVVDPQYRSWKEHTLCYRRILSWQLRSQPSKAKAFLDDWKERKIIVIGGWSSDVGMSKAWPALLKPKNFPETFLLSDSLNQKLMEEKDQWVIKAALSYSGNAIFRGSDLTTERWKRCLDQASSESRQGRNWIVQKRIQIPLIEGKPCEFGLYFLNGKASGYMARWGSHSSISETSQEVFRPVKITS